MSNNYHWNGFEPSVCSLCRTICIWVISALVTTTLPLSEMNGNKRTIAPETTPPGLIPTVLGMTDPVEFIFKGPSMLGGLYRLQHLLNAPIEAIPSIMTFPLGLKSQPQPVFISSEAPPPSKLPLSTTRPPSLIASELAPISDLPPSKPSSIDPGNTTPALNPPDGSNLPNVSTAIVAPSMTSKGEGARPIPAPSTSPGDPDGHHEVPEPGFTTTSSCRACSPALAIPATDWGDMTPPTPSRAGAAPQETLGRPAEAIITAGPSTIVIKPQPTREGSSTGGDGGGNGEGNIFIIDDGLTTIIPGQTITLDRTPLVIQRTSSHKEVLFGIGSPSTQTIPFQIPAPPGVTETPLTLLPVTIGSQSLTPILNTDSRVTKQIPALYLINGQTLMPGGAPLTISGTTYSLPAAPTAVVVNGQTSAINPSYGNMQPKLAIPYLTLFHTTYTANAAGNYVFAPGVTLRPGAEAITVSGTVVSLLPGRTETLVQETTSLMALDTAVVTLTRSTGETHGGGSGGPAGSAAATLPYPAGAMRMDVGVGGGGSVEGFLVLGVLIFGRFAVWI